MLVVLALLVAGCAWLEGPREPKTSEEERRAYGDALSTLVDDPEGTERALQEFVRLYPASPLADDAGMRLGEIALARGDTDAALRRFYWVVRSQPKGDRVDAARVEIARLEYARGNAEAAAAVLQRAKLSKLSSAERRVAYRVLASVAEDPVDCAGWPGCAPRRPTRMRWPSWMSRSTSYCFRWTRSTCCAPPSRSAAKSPPPAHC
jgi:hypothetical protein